MVQWNLKIKTVLLSTLSEFSNGKFLPTKERSIIGKYDVYGSNGIITKTEKFLYDQPVIVIGRVGANCGTIHRTENLSWITDNCIVSIPKPETDFNFLFYALKFLNLNYLAIGSAQPLLTQDILNSIDIMSVTLPQQQKIGKILYDLDRKIENFQNQNEILEQITQVIFKSWFEDFDGITEFQDSELGKIPKGWNVGIFQNIVDIGSGKRPNDKRLIRTSEYNIPCHGASKIDAYVKVPLFEKPILLTGRVGTLGIVHRISFPCFPSDNTLIIVAQDNIFYEYVYFCITKIDFNSYNRGTSQPLLTQTDIKNIKIIIPSKKIIESFSKLIKEFFNQIDHNNLQIINLVKTRDFLLPKLMSGEIML